MATNKIQTGLRLNEPIYEKLKFLSAREHRSLNNLIEFIVQQYVDDYEKSNGIISIPNEE